MSKEMLIQNEYIKDNVNKNWLANHNFHHNAILSYGDDTIYTYRFPVFKNGSFTLLECEVGITLETGKVNLNVYDYGTRSIYAPFYCNEYGRNQMLDKVNEKIKTKLRNLKIRQVKKED